LWPKPSSMSKPPRRRDRRQCQASIFAALSAWRLAVRADRSQFWKELSMPFFSYNRPGAKISEGVRNSFWLQGMMAGIPASYFCIKAFSETDFTDDLTEFDVPTLILHGDDRCLQVSPEGLEPSPVSSWRWH
jgi:pimeloyl-ACP methyl ester carboxylesterase